MSPSERDVLEAIDRAVLDPPPMTLSPDAVVTLGRSKVRRRRAVAGGMSIAAAAVAVTAWVGLSSGFDVLGDQVSPAGDGSRQGGATYVVRSGWPDGARSFAVVADPSTGATMVTPVQADPGAPSGEVAATVPAAPGGEPFEVISLAAFTGRAESDDCDIHLADDADAGVPVALDSTGGVANARLLDDGAHWLTCVVGDVFVGPVDQPVAHWRGNTMLPVEDWSQGFPDGIIAVTTSDAARDLTPVWEGDPAYDLGDPVTTPLGGETVLLNWSLPLPELGGELADGLTGFDADGDGVVDLPLVPIGTNRGLTDGLPLSETLAPPASDE